jgi:hypothetical protein
MLSIVEWNSKKLWTQVKDLLFLRTFTGVGMGLQHQKGSEDCLIDWITTIENASSYFGGVGKDEQASANRKHMYHLLLSDTICKENGEYYVVC